MNKGASVIRTALTTKLTLELTYRDPQVQMASACAYDEGLDNASDLLVWSDASDDLSVPTLRAL